MRIGMVASLPESVPPKKYGGTERVIYHLTEGLIARGHDVTLFASGDSRTSARLVSVVEKSLRRLKTKDLYGFNTPTMMNIGAAYAMQDRFDIIHDHNPHISLPTANIARVPVVVTWHGPFDEQVTPLFQLLNKPYVVSISDAQGKPAPGVNFLGTVYNGLPMENYPFSDQPEDYLLYVGRIDAEKGTHIAIDVAVQLGKKLIIAAKADVDVQHIRQYFEREVEPRLQAHKNLVTWIGEVDETERNELMAKALCLLHPVTWPEPFGLTVIEAMGCGCPVVAFRRGSMPELISSGRTGFLVDDFDEMLEAVRRIGSISREECRRHSLRNFSADRMVEGYINAYETAIRQSRIKSGESQRRDKRSRIFSEFRP